MTFQQLRYLLEVSKTGSIAKAAENLFVTRPGVSLSINSLETELGYPVFKRTQQGLIPTEQGKEVLEYASRIFENYQHITTIGNKRSEKVKIATVNHQSVRNAAMQLYKEFRNTEESSVMFVNNFGAIKKLAIGDLDLALSSPFEENLQANIQSIESKKLHWEILEKIPVVICIGPGHPLYDKPDVTPQDFARDSLVDTPTMAFSRSNLLQKYMPFNKDLAYTTEHFHNEFIEAGLGYSVRRMPPDDFIARYRFRCIPIEGFYQILLCVTNPARELPYPAQRFLELLKEEIPSDL